MLHLASKILGAKVVTTDGELGGCEDFVFDERWLVLYLVVDPWQGNRRLAIPTSYVRGSWNRASITVEMTQAQLLACAELGSDSTVPAQSIDGRLWSTKSSTGYHIEATDGEIGHVDDYLIDEASWRIRYLLVDTSNWLGGRSVVVSTAVVGLPEREEQVLPVGFSRESIRSSPSFDALVGSLRPEETGPPFAFI